MKKPGISELRLLVRSVRVEEKFIRVEFATDCGEFEKAITLDRAPASTDKDSNLKHWFRSKLLGSLEGERCIDEASDSEVEEAIWRGFEQVREFLRFEKGRWLKSRPGKHPGQLFDQQLRTNPIVEAYDIEVLVRVMLEVSRSDSEFRVEERAFLSEIVQDEQTIERLSNAPSITVAELAETSSVSVKETILMLAWAMAYADGRLDSDEMLRINRLCQGFLLEEDRVRELQNASKLFLLDRHFRYLKGRVPDEDLRDSFEQKARQWGLEEPQIETLRSWYPLDLTCDA